MQVSLYVKSKESFKFLHIVKFFQSKLYGKCNVSWYHEDFQRSLCVILSSLKFKVKIEMTCTES